MTRLTEEEKDLLVERFTAAELCDLLGVDIEDFILIAIQEDWISEEALEDLKEIIGVT